MIVTFFLKGDSTAAVLHCIELDKFINREIVETRSDFIAHRRVVYNDGGKTFV